MHALADFNKDNTIVDESLEFVLLHDLVGNDPSGDSYVLISLNRGVKI